MKLYILLTSMAFFSCLGNSARRPVLQLEQSAINMGNIPLKTTQEVRFTFSNEGSADLLIDTVTSSCGCSVPQLSKSKLKAGDTASLLVKFTPADTGRFKKTLVIRSNTDSMFSVVTFSGRALGSNLLGKPL